MANKRNYAKELNTLIETFTHEEKRPTLLLHACCAPCSSAVLEKLTAHFKITVLFYNPNIYPEAEYQKREAELKRLISEMPCTKEVALVDLPYVPEEFFTAVRGLEHIPEGGVLVSDNVLQDGDVIESRYAVERRNRTIHSRMREYLFELKHSDIYETSILPLGDGIALSVKRRTSEK